MPRKPKNAVEAIREAEEETRLEELVAGLIDGSEAEEGESSQTEAEEDFGPPTGDADAGPDDSVGAEGSDDAEDDGGPTETETEEVPYGYVDDRSKTLGGTTVWTS